MRFIQLLTAFVSMLGLAQAGLSNEAVLKLSKQSGPNRVIPVTETNYEKLLSGPRDYHLVVYLTSSAPQFKCVLCAEVRPAFDVVAHSWAENFPEGAGHLENGQDVFFLAAEFADAKELFQKLKLDSIPKMYHFPPTTDATASGWLKENDEYLFFQGDHIELIAEWVGSFSGQKFAIKVPINFTRIAINAAITFAVVVSAVVFRGVVIGFATSRLIWTGISTSAILLLTSGYMFNKIRQTPFIKENPNGSVEYFVGGQQNQLGVETQIVSFVYGILSLLFIVLVKKVPELKNSQVKLIATSIITVAIFGFSSILLSIFGMKTPGFPFKFLDIKL